MSYLMARAVLDCMATLYRRRMAVDPANIELQVEPACIDVGHDSGRSFTGEEKWGRGRGKEKLRTSEGSNVLQRGGL